MARGQGSPQGGGLGASCLQQQQPQQESKGAQQSHQGLNSEHSTTIASFLVSKSDVSAVLSCCVCSFLPADHHPGALPAVPHPVQ